MTPVDITRTMAAQETPGFGNELGAEMSVQESFDQAKLETTIPTNMLRVRFVNMPYGKPRYWFADAQETLLRGKTPERFIETAKAVYELRLRALDSLNEKFKMDNISPTEMHTIVESIMTQTCPNTMQLDRTKIKYISHCSGDYAQLSVQAFRENPACLFTAVRRILDKKIPLTPYARRLGERITESAAYFNPDFLDPNYARKNPPSVPYSLAVA